MAYCSEVDKPAYIILKRDPAKTGAFSLTLGGIQSTLSEGMYFHEKETHHDKGVCQESYDQGYEEGYRAGQKGDDSRIK